MKIQSSDGMVSSFLCIPIFLSLSLSLLAFPTKCQIIMAMLTVKPLLPV